MTTLAVYVQQLWDRQVIVAGKLGSDISQGQKQDRVSDKSLLVLLAAVIKTLVDKGLVSDAEILATLNAARDDVYSDQPVEAPPP